MRKLGSFIFVVSLFVSIGTLASAQPAAQTAPEHYQNPNANPDPNFVPGDYPAPDAEAAIVQYDTLVEQMAPEGDVYYVTNEEEDEITWTSIKNETAEVLGYFRTFDGYVTFADDHFVKAELLIDVNSLDSAVPARDNRLKAILLQSMKPQMGTARLVLDKVEGNPTVTSMQDGAAHTVKLTGNFTLGAVTVPVTAQLEIKWDTEEEIWHARTVEPISLLLSSLKLDGSVPALMKECNHAALGNLVKIACKLRFE